jgi:hypothetical protein
MEGGEHLAGYGPITTATQVWITLWTKVHERA